MEIAVRPATIADHERVIEIAHEGDFTDCEAQYLSFIASVGRLLCATTDDTIVGFGGMVPTSDVAMVTDLFVATTARAQGVGGRLLDELLDGWPRRMTFSAQNAAALAVYRRAGMQPRGRMLYLSGSACGGSAALEPGTWLHDRADLVAYFATNGASVTSDAVVSIHTRGIQLLRLDAADAVAECQRILDAFAPGTAVTLYAPEAHRITDWLRRRDFVATDHDVLCTSEGVELPANLAVLHPGLA